RPFDDRPRHAPWSAPRPPWPTVRRPAAPSRGRRFFAPSSRRRCPPSSPPAPATAWSLLPPAYTGAAGPAQHARPGRASTRPVRLQLVRGDPSASQLVARVADGAGAAEPAPARDPTLGAARHVEVGVAVHVELQLGTPGRQNPQHVASRLAHPVPVQLSRRG